MSTTETKVINTARDLELAIIDSGGVISPELEAQIFSLDLNRAEAIDMARALLGRISSASEHWKARATEMYNVAKGLSLLEVRYKNYIKDLMIDARVSDIYGAEYRFKLSELKPKAVFNDAELPREFLKEIIDYVPDREKILDALTTGVEVPGARLEPVHSLRQYPNKKELGLK